MPNWTDEEIATLKRWWPRITAKAVAGRVGRSYSATYQKALALGLSKRLSSAKQVTEWVGSYTEIYPHAKLLSDKGVPMEVRTKFVHQHEQFAVFRIYPRRIEKYWKEYGTECTN